MNIMINFLWLFSCQKIPEFYADVNRTIAILTFTSVILAFLPPSISWIHCEGVTENLCNIMLEVKIYSRSNLHLKWSVTLRCDGLATITSRVIRTSSLKAKLKFSLQMALPSFYIPYNIDTQFTYKTDTCQLLSQPNSLSLSTGNMTMTVMFEANEFSSVEMWKKRPKYTQLYKKSNRTSVLFNF